MVLNETEAPFEQSKVVVTNAHVDHRTSLGKPGIR
jgi:hypothetical protein